MADIKLPRLPDRSPIKLAITVSPELKRGLDRYAVYYAANYGAEESVANLIPAMLENFLASDREFIKAHKGAVGKS